MPCDKYFMLISEVISINLTKPKRQRSRTSSTPIADPLKHERVIRKLTKQFTRRSNLPHVTQDDIRIATNRAEIAQKRVDLEYQNRLKQAQQRHDANRHWAFVQRIHSKTPQSNAERFFSVVDSNDALAWKTLRASVLKEYFFFGSAAARLNTLELLSSVKTLAKVQRFARKVCNKASNKVYLLMYLCRE